MKPFMVRWAALVVGLVVVGGTGLGLWLLSPSATREYSFALLAIAAVAAVLSAVQLARGEFHQRTTSRKLSEVAGLLRVEAILEVGFARGEYEGPVGEIEVTPDWADRGGPAVKVISVSADPFEPDVVEPASDLVRIQFRVINTRGRDPAQEVFVGVRLPEGCEGYDIDEFQDIRATWRLRETGSATVNRSDRRDIRLGWHGITNGTFATTDPVWLRLPPGTKGNVSVHYRAAAARISPIVGELTIKVA